MVSPEKFSSMYSLLVKVSLCISLVITLNACEGLFGTYSGDKEQQRKLVTLGDIAATPPTIQNVKAKNLSAVDVISSYEEALKETDDVLIKEESAKRIANLSLIATEDRILEQAHLADQIDKLDQENTKISELPETEDPVLQQSRKEQLSKNQQDIANAEARIVELDKQNQNSYYDAIHIYERVVKENPVAENNDIIYYQLAAAYDSQGDENKVAWALDQISEHYPDSDYYTEAQFRRAEIYFSTGDFITAGEAYNAAINSKTDMRFADHALYKHGWSLFKINEYELAINDFVKLRDQLEQKKSSGAVDDKLINDTNRVVALSFSHLSNPEELKKYFDSIGNRPYELAIYRELHHNYINQERYKDAATTYDVFLEAYPFHKEAPIMQSDILQAYQDGGFPSMVLPGKIDYVKRFGIHSEYWKRFVAEGSPERNYSAEEKEELTDEIKKHLADVSRHYHSIAQRSRKIDDYRQAATWYREYLDTFANKDGVDTAETLEIRKLLAESLYESEQYELAIVEFETLARASGDNKEAGANASYFVLLSYQQMLKNYQGDEEGKNQLLAKKVDSSRYFIDNYRDDKRMPNVLGNIVRDQLTIKDFEGAVKNSRVLVSLDPPAPIDMQRTAWVTIANAEFDAKDYTNSEKSYQKVLSFDGFSRAQRDTYQTQIEHSIYKNAESLKEKGELVPAAQEFLRLGQVAPTSTIRPQAHFDAANLYLEAKQWEKAIETLNLFRRLYPNHKLLETFPDKMAVAYKNTDQFDKAADQYIILAQRYEKTDPELARQTLWEAAELKEKANNTQGARDLYRDYANLYPSPLEQNVEAQYKLVGFYKAENNDYRVSFWSDKIIKSHASAGKENTPRITYLAAQMRFETTEIEYRRYQNIKIKQPLKRSLERKRAQMDTVLVQYQEISKMGSAEWTAASNYRIARVYQILASDLLNSERPKGLTAEQLEQYDILIEEQAYPFEDQAIEIHVHNTDLVKNNIYNEWIKESFNELAKLIPARYAKQEKRTYYVESIY